LQLERVFSCAERVVGTYRQMRLTGAFKSTTEVIKVKPFRQLFMIVAISLLLLSQGRWLNAQQAGAKHYPLTGIVVSVDASHSQLTVDAQAIPGYMDAMTMPYTVAGSSNLKALKKGDHIRATVVVQGDDERLENVTVVSPPKGR
jgi:Cu/Ag efflux protein CusF